MYIVREKELDILCIMKYKEMMKMDFVLLKSRLEKEKEDYSLLLFKHGSSAIKELHLLKRKRREVARLKMAYLTRRKSESGEAKKVLK